MTIQPAESPEDTNSMEKTEKLALTLEIFIIRE